MSSPASLTFFNDEFFFLPPSLEQHFKITLLVKALKHDPDAQIFLLRALFCSHMLEEFVSKNFYKGRQNDRKQQKSSLSGFQSVPVKESVIARLCVNDLFERLGCSWLVITPPNLCPNI